MRRVLLSIIVFLFASEIVAYSQDSIDVAKKHDKSFSINLSATFDNYGSFNVKGKSVSTEYAGFRIAPDWRFSRHWGLRLDLGAGWAFTANTAGSWERPMHSTCNVNVALVPYIEFIKNRWFFDVGAVVGCRLRLPYMNMELSRYLETVSVSLGLDFRFGYKLAQRWNVFGDVNAQRTVYDLLAKTYYPAERLNSGCINASIGVGYRIK